MSLIFIPTGDFSRNANTAATISEYDLGSIRIGTSVTFCFRIGNTGTTVVNWSLSVTDNSDPEITDKWVLPKGGTLEPGQTTNTLTVGMRLPLNAIELTHLIDLVATDGTNEYTLEVEYEAMGTNSWRRANYPRRAGDWTNTASGVIDNLGDILRILVFDPLPYPGPPGFGQKVPIEIGDCQESLAEYREIKILDGSDPCQRLHPRNETYGYQQSVYIIHGQFSRENRETRYFNLKANDTEMEYQVSATLAFTAEDELIRQWALFEPATEMEPAQYKRSVFILQRQGELFSIENIRTIDRGSELSHFQSDLVALHNPYQGNTTYWNPFALTYEFENDKPYAMFSCFIDLPKEEPYYWPATDISGAIILQD